MSVHSASCPQALAKYEASRNLGEELLAAAREIKAGKAARVHNIKVPEILEARMRTGLSQQKFADVLGVCLKRVDSMLVCQLGVQATQLDGTRPFICGNLVGTANLDINREFSAIRS